MTHSTRSSVRPGLASMCPEPCSWTWSPPWSMKCARGPTGSSSTRSS
ncbi:hypothetical protein E2I00_007044 [Balaenoptera physalus]|uniref:Uncharacterized protein n=1 Tax=Balaenoptera physalus TaxID=9770 RepID=A0A643AT50_BALPH|nr:hypothetical protein E2I00_007044 [Balaenoptera physalus]